MFSRKHREFGIFFMATRCDGLISLFLQRFIGLYIYPLFSQNIQPKCIVRFLWWTEVLHREEMGIGSLKSWVWETASFGLWTWMVNNRGRATWTIMTTFIWFFFSEITVIFITVLIISLVFDRLQLFFRRSSPFLFCHCCSSVKFQSATF